MSDYACHMPIICDLAVSADAIAAAYRGDVRWLQARARDGRSVRLPIMALRPWVARSGIHGAFALNVDDGNRLLGIERLDAAAGSRRHDAASGRPRSVRS